jgi:hypothetical protein
MFSARGVALKVTTVSVQLRVLHNIVYISARLKLPGTNSTYTGRHKHRIKARADIYALNEIQTHDPSVQEGEDISCLTPPGHRYRPLTL